MATVIPFKGVLPAKNKVNLIPSKTVTRYSKQEFQKEMENNPYSFLQIIFPEHPQKVTNANSSEYLHKIKLTYKRFIKQELLIQDTQPCFYLYQQKDKNHSYHGIIACCSVDDYLNGIIKIHEQTFKDRVEKLTNYLKTCDFNAEPVLMTYPDNDGLNEIMHLIASSSPTFNFKAVSDNIHHTLWRIDKTAYIEKIKQYFKKIPALYIADGHHRSASSVLLAKHHRQLKPNYSGSEAFNYFLTLLLPESQLQIFDYNRVLKTLNGLTPNQFLNELSNFFILEPTSEKTAKPSKKGNLCLYLEQKWFSLQIRHKLQDKNTLDASYLSEHIFHSILKLGRGQQIKYVEGTKGIAELKRLVDTGKYQAAFALYPVTIKEIRQIADAGKIMPPKTTWIEPKLRSGLVIYDLNDKTGK